MTGRWFKFNPKSFREGTDQLTLEERGAYITILCLIYERGGPIPDEPRWLAGHCLVSVRAWSKVRVALLAKGKISLDNEGRLANEKARKVLESFVKPEDNSRETSAKVQDNSDETRPTPNKNSKLSAEQSALFETKIEPPEEEGEREEEANASSASKPAKAKSRRKPEVSIPAGFPDDAALLMGRDKLRAAGVDLDVNSQADRFRNHAEQIDRRCRDWTAAWRNWIGTAIDRAPKRPGAATPAAVAACKFPGPAEIRADVAHYAREDFTMKTLDRCGWREADRTITAPTTFTAERLRQEVGHILDQHSVKLVALAAKAAA